ncbi:putative transcriptional regulator [Geoglobus ahangari]|uniref:Putative transcriptional regulator n=1 Tax=Geoglobus ahangari TaxID=113653 RepID=A0A0F7IFM0_9EURY|nr:winged helix DNA-binding protein [Geoglobus ahangari]AKG91934.1 putative transcriptional regulator [Geoglobus ahangari]
MLEEEILRVLEERRFEGILQSDLVRLLKASKSRVSEVLRVLEKNGLIVREREAGKNLRIWLAEYSARRVKVGILRASEYAKLISAGEYSFIVYGNAIDLTRDLALGKIEFGASPLVTQIMFGVMMKNIKIVGVVAENGSGVVFGDEKNGVFATTEMSAMEMNLRATREKLGVRSFRYCDSPECLLSSLEGVEGIAIWEPYFTQIEREKLPFSEIVGDFPCCTLAVNAGFLRENEGEVENLVRGMSRASVDLNKVSRVLDFDRQVVERSLSSYRFAPSYTIEEVERYLKRGGVEISRESLSGVFEYL